MALDNIVSPLRLLSPICLHRSSFSGTQSFVCWQRTCFMRVVEQQFASHSLQAVSMVIFLRFLNPVLSRNPTRIDTRLEDSSQHCQSFDRHQRSPHSFFQYLSSLSSWFQWREEHAGVRWHPSTIPSERSLTASSPSETLWRHAVRTDRWFHWHVERSRSNSLLRQRFDHISRLKEFIDIDQQKFPGYALSLQKKKISRSVLKPFQWRRRVKRQHFLGHSALLKDIFDASFKPCIFDHCQWNGSVVVHWYSNTLGTRSVRFHSDWSSNPTERRSRNSVEHRLDEFGCSRPHQRSKNNRSGMTSLFLFFFFEICWSSPWTIHWMSTFRICRFSLRLSFCWWTHAGPLTWRASIHGLLINILHSLCRSSLNLNSTRGLTVFFDYPGRSFLFWVSLYFAWPFAEDRTTGTNDLNAKN